MPKLKLYLYITLVFIISLLEVLNVLVTYDKFFIYIIQKNYWLKSGHV